MHRLSLIQYSFINFCHQIRSHDYVLIKNRELIQTLFDRILTSVSKVEIALQFLLKVLGIKIKVFLCKRKSNCLFYFSEKGLFRINNNRMYKTDCLQL